MCTRTIAQASQSLGLNMQNNSSASIPARNISSYCSAMCVKLTLDWSCLRFSQAWGPGAELAACGEGWVLIQGFDWHKPQKPDSLNSCIFSSGPRDGRIRLQESRLEDTPCHHHLAGVTRCQSCVQAAGEVGVLTGHSQKSHR